MEELKKILHSDIRYRDFSLLTKPVPFNELFFNKDIPCVQLHSIRMCNDQHILGFCGCFKWENNKVIPLDGDSYSQDELIYGYEWFTDNDNNKCLDILVDW